MREGVGVAVVLPPGRGNVLVDDGVVEGVTEVGFVEPGVVDVGVGVADPVFASDEELDDDGERVADVVGDLGLVELGVGVGVERVVRCGASWFAEIGRMRK